MLGMARACKTAGEGPRAGDEPPHGHREAALQRDGVQPGADGLVSVRIVHSKMTNIPFLWMSETVTSRARR